jgi:YegS/Rv2252/BmrU family lipid kinase
VTNVLVVANPVAGTRDIRRVRAVVQRRLDAAGWEHEWFVATSEDGTRDAVHDAVGRGFDLVIAAGGDGTVSTVADALVASPVPLAILPTGTGNGVALQLRQPLSVAGSLDMIVGQHDVRFMDTVRVGDAHFLLNVTVGITASTMHETHQEAKRRFGRAAYAWTLALKLAGLQPHRFRLTLDGAEHTVRAADIMVANCAAVGTPIARWGPHVRPDDGCLNVIVVRADTVPRLLRVVLNVILRRPERDPDLDFMTAARSVEIEANRPLPIQGDGEFVGWVPVRMEVVPNAVRVIAPRQRSQPGLRPQAPSP